MTEKHSGWACLLVLAITASLSACSSTERTSDLENHRLVVGSSTKSDVVNAIGLPRKIDRDDAQGGEAWLYTGKPINTSFLFPVAAVMTAPSTMSVYLANVGTQSTIDNEPVTLICFFDKTGRVIDIRRPNQGAR
ncbi:hypothetical protein VVD49_19540 [Uliginosibacterium sp. H3]|uniref:Lipoprotein SmpA/OmlA domain-containing protein n=1 Tax=Uliginosibacterium silvisoli TaxID=3114758 RepID=A0ABU6K8M1_9RHOO|nr:hypothetical protein [Uliginosibacterium sp. H3]